MAPTKKTTQSAKKSIGVEITIIDTNGKEVSKLSLPVDIFGVKASDKLLSQYVRVYLANQRQGTASAKMRGEVNATTKKVYRQKGTGRARHGAKTAALFVGGGVTHGPKPRDYSLKLNKKQKVKALLYALSLKAQNNSLTVIQGFDKLGMKTKNASEMLKNVGLDGKKALVIYAPTQAEMTRKTLANIDVIKGSQSRLLNAYDILIAQNLVFTQEGLDDFLSFRSAPQA